MNKKILREGRWAVVLFGVLLALIGNTAFAASTSSVSISLTPGWNIISTPRILASHVFSAPETLANFSVYTLDPTHPSGWATLADLGQTEFTPLYGYFINNKTASSQVLTLNFKASTSPNERLFSRNFASTGWYAFGIANPSYAKTQNANTVDVNNPDHILNSLLATTSTYDSVIDFTDAAFPQNPTSVTLKDPWKLAVRSVDVTNTTEINSLNDFRETKGYAIYIKQPNSILNGFQTDRVPMGTLSLSKSAGYPNQITGVPQASYEIGEYQVVTGGNDTFTIGTVGLGLIGSTTTISSLANVYMVIGPTSTPAYTMGTSTLFWNGEGEVFPANSTTTLKVFASLPSSLASGTIATILALDGASHNSGDTVSTAIVNGQSISIRAQISTSTPSLTLAKYSAYVNQTVTVPQSSYKLAEFRLSTGVNDGAVLSSINLNLTGIAAFSSLTNLYVVYGGKTTIIKPTGAISQTWTVNEQMATNTTMSVAVYASLPSVFTAGQTITPILSIDGVSQVGAIPLTTMQVIGQTITTGAGSLTTTVDASTPVSALVVGYTMPKIGSFKFTASNDAFTIDELAAKLSSASVGDVSAITELVFKDGVTELKRQSFNGIYATATGLSIPIPTNGSKVIDVYANLGGIGTGFASSGANVGITLAGYESLNSSGVKQRTYPAGIQSNSFYTYKTKPTITNVALPTTVLATGTQTVYQYTITADAGGTVAWRTTKFTIATSSATASSFNLYDSANQSTALANTTCTLAGTVVTCVSTQDQEVSGSKTYVLKATIGGLITTGASVSVNIANSGQPYTASTDAASVNAASTFVWSDESVVPHSAATADWDNDFLIKNLPTDSETMTK